MHRPAQHNEQLWVCLACKKQQRFHGPRTMKLLFDAPVFALVVLLKQRDTPLDFAKRKV